MKLDCQVKQEEHLFRWDAQSVQNSYHSAATQRLSRQAYNKIVASQQANEWAMDGHAQKAKGLLDKVNRELKLAAEAANRSKKR